jgi:hypothetical protein
MGNIGGENNLPRSFSVETSHCHYGIVLMRSPRRTERYTGETMKDRLPTEFETNVLKRIDNGRGLLAGDGQVAISAACRRLEKLGYAAHPGTRWYVTTKGDEYLARKRKIACQQAQDCLTPEEFRRWREQYG